VPMQCSNEHWQYPDGKYIPPISPCWWKSCGHEIQCYQCADYVHAFPETNWHMCKPYGGHIATYCQQWWSCSGQYSLPECNCKPLAKSKIVGGPGLKAPPEPKIKVPDWAVDKPKIKIPDWAKDELRPVPPTVTPPPDRPLLPPPPPLDPPVEMKPCYKWHCWRKEWDQKKGKTVWDYKGVFGTCEDCLLAFGSQKGLADPLIDQEYEECECGTVLPNGFTCQPLSKTCELATMTPVSP